LLCNKDQEYHKFRNLPVQVKERTAHLR